MGFGATKMNNALLEQIASYASESGNDSQDHWVDLEIPHTIYAMLITPRSGSTFLTHALSKTKRVGIPQEWFNHDSLHKVIAGSGAPDIRTYIDFLLRSKKTENGIFGVQFSWPQWKTLSDAIDFQEHVKKTIIWFSLRRRNVVAQAVSLHMAVETGIFHSYQLQSDGDEKFEAVKYSRTKIKNFVKTLVDQESAIERYFVQHNIVAVNLFYEDVIGSERAAIDLFRNVLRVRYNPTAADLINPISRVSTDINTQFENRFREEEAAFLDEVVQYRPRVWLEGQEV